MASTKSSYGFCGNSTGVTFSMQKFQNILVFRIDSSPDDVSFHITKVLFLTDVSVITSVYQSARCIEHLVAAAGRNQVILSQCLNAQLSDCAVKGFEANGTLDSQ